MAAHKWWRVRATQPNSGSSSLYLLEVAFLASITDAVTSTGGVALASAFDASYPPSKAFDGSTATGSGWWPGTTPTFPVWIGYNHAAAVEVAGVLITTGNSSLDFPNDNWLFLDYSDDGTTWVTAGPLKARDSLSWGIAVARRFAVAPISSSDIVSKFLQNVRRQYGDQLPQRPHARRFAGGGVWRWETQTTGSGTISGIVTIENIPGSRKVRLYRKHDGMLLRETWSAPNGAYSFSNLDPAWEYFVVAHDHLRVYNGVIQDMITP